MSKNSEDLRTVVNETSNPSSILGEALLGAIRQAVREEIEASQSRNGHCCKIVTEPAKSYFKIAEAAKFSCLADSTIRFYMRKGKLKALKVGSRVIIKREDLDTFLETHRKEIQPK